MKRSVYTLVRLSLPGLILCFLVLAAVVGPEITKSSGSVAKPLRNIAAQTEAPAVTQLCFTGQSLATGDASAGQRGNTAALVDSAGCNMASSGCAVQGGNAFFYDVYAINATGCGAGNPSITARTCNTACGQAAGTADTLVFIYQKASGAPGTFGNAVFDPANPCTNLRGGDNNGCSPQSTQTVTLCSGIFVVVVTHNLQTSSCPTPNTNCGTYNLEITVNAGTTCQITQVPTAVALDAFAANGYVEGTNINWKTGREVNNLGFNLYRQDGGKRTRINDQVLAGSALLAGAGTDLKSGQSYAWTDRLPATRNTQYWLEDLGLDGQSTWHGPFDVNRSALREHLPPAKGRAQLLNKLGTGSSQAGRTTPLQRQASSPGVPLMGAEGMRIASQPGAASVPSIKLSAKQEGWYRVTASELAASGFDTRVDPRMLQLSVDGQEQAITVRGEEDGRFDATDAIEFYGIGLDSAATDSRTYWLMAGSQPGLRIEKIKGKGSRGTPSSFPYTVERRDRTIYFSALRNGERENFFGAVVGRDPVNQSISVLHLDPAATGAELEIGLQGVTALSHRVHVEVNNVEVGAIGFDGQVEGSTKFPLARDLLREGENSIRLTAFGGDSDISLVQNVRITYPHTYTADGDALRFSLSAKQQVTIDGFTNSGIRVFDVTDPGAIREITSRVESRKGAYSVTVSAPKGGGERLLLAVADGAAIRPAEIVLNRPSNLREPGRGADVVIISHRDFVDAVAPLKAAREKQGFSVAVADIEDVYDDFSFGQKSPQAVKDFLLFARSNWGTPPRYVLLVGDASLDPKGYLGFGNADFVPTKLIDTTLMETASDDWFVDFNGDGAADIAIGRLPVRTSEEAAAMIAKIIDYDNSEPVNRVMLVSDTGDDYDFAAFNAELRNEMPRNMIVQEINRGSVADAQSELIAGLDQGQKIVNYVGHGNINQWRGNVLTSASASTLTNSRHLPFFVMMTCLNGYFQDASLEGLAEALMKSERGGAIAVWASSGMTSPTGQNELNQQILRVVLASGSGSSTLGEATVQAKSAVSDTDVRRTWILFGDPTMRLR